MTAVASNVVHVDADAAGVLRYDGALLERVEDALDAVVAHRQQEATTQLRSIRACVEQRGRGVHEPLLRHEIVRLDGSVDVLAVYADRDAHHHVLRPLNGTTVDLEQVGLLQSLEAEIVVVEIAVVDDR